MVYSFIHSHSFVPPNLVPPKSFVLLIQVLLNAFFHVSCRTVFLVMMYLLKEEEPKEGPQAKKEKNVSQLFYLKNLFLVIKSFLRG